MLRSGWRRDGRGECIVGGVGGGREELAELAVLILEEESESSDSGWDNGNGLLEHPSLRNRFEASSFTEPDEDLLRHIKLDNGGEREVDVACTSLSGDIVEEQACTCSLI